MRCMIPAMNEVTGQRLQRVFFARSPLDVAVDLLGKPLVRLLNGQRLSGLIVETEAYCAAQEERDLACHGDRANDGRPTARTAVMFGPAGYSYVYFTYGMHWMFNIVTGETGQAGAVLIRALQPLDGLEVMRRLRGRPDAELTNGPAKLAQALALTGDDNGLDLCAAGGTLWIEDAQRLPLENVARGPRVGLGKTPEPWLSKPWRFWMRGNRYVSR